MELEKRLVLQEAYEKLGTAHTDYSVLMTAAIDARDEVTINRLHARIADITEIREAMERLFGASDANEW